MISQIANAFIDQCVFRMNENTRRVKGCLEELSEDEIWRRPNGASNSVGNQILHLCGNIHQYIQSSLGHKPDIRDRDAEFAATAGHSKSELLNQLTRTADTANEIMKTLDDETLIKTHLVQGFNMPGLGNIIQVVEHYSYHTGQIAFWTKILHPKDLGFYHGTDLNKKNTPIR